MLLDLDHFKNVNDALGHDEGDRVLTALAAHLRAIVRDGDDIARYGGEEFLVVLRRADGAVGDVARRLLEGWRRTEPLATFSAGVAIHRLADAPAATLGRADAALYDAKRSGRDRVIVCDERAPEGTAVS